MASKSKNKGKNFERKICLLLTEIFGEKFIRVPTSGAFTGGKNIKRLEELDSRQQTFMTGDIIPPSPYDVINFECKHYKLFPWRKVLNGKTSSAMLDKWIKEASQAVPFYKQTWFLIFKTNRKPETIVYPESFSTVWKGKVKELYSYTTREGIKVLLCPLKDFLEANKDYITQFCQKLNRFKDREGIEDVL